MQKHQLKTLARVVLAGSALLSILPRAFATDWTEGHGDIAANHVAGEWRFGVIINSISGVEFAPHEVLIQAGDNARLAIPGGPNFSFLGTAGDPVWIYPQSQAAGIPFIGISAEATPLDTFAGNRFDLQLTSVAGPGDFFLWTTGGTGTPTVQINSRDGISATDVFDVPSGGHNHMNWGFSSPGTHRIGFKGSGTLTGQPSPTTSDEAIYTFEVSVLKNGEVDLEVAYEGGELEFHLHDETTDTEFEPAHVALQAGPATWTTVPTEDAFGFLGAAGEHLYILPQDERAGVLFLGLAAGEIPAGTFVDDQLSVQLTAVGGPGAVYHYEVDGFGAPIVFFNSADGLTTDDLVAVAIGWHAHRNWAFSTPGVYRVTLVASGELIGGGTVTSEPATFLFEVLPPQFFDRGEIDLEIVFEEDAFELELLDEARGREYAAHEAVLVGRPPARATVPADPAFAFLGNPGAMVYVLPQDETEGLLFLGIAADEIAPGLFVGETVDLTLLANSGPGEVALYSVDGFGAPTVFINSRDGLGATDVYPVGVGSHSHLNWAFSAQGEYRLTFQAAGTLVAGNQPIESGEVTLTFIVEDSGPVLTAAVVNDGATLRIGWESRAGVSYQLQSRTSLNGSEWRIEGDPINGDGTLRTVDTPVTSDLVKMFRLIEIQP